MFDYLAISSGSSVVVLVVVVVERVVVDVVVVVVVDVLDESDFLLEETRLVLQNSGV